MFFPQRNRIRAHAGLAAAAETAVATATAAAAGPLLKGQGFSTGSQLACGEAIQMWWRALLCAPPWQRQATEQKQS